MSVDLMWENKRLRRVDMIYEMGSLCVYVTGDTRGM